MADEDTGYGNDDEVRIADPLLDQLDNTDYPRSSPETDIGLTKSTVKFLTSHMDHGLDEARVELVLEKQEYYGLTRDELLEYEKNSSWRCLRLFGIIIALTVAFTIIATSFLLQSLIGPCPLRPQPDWCNQTIIYEIYVPSFRIGQYCESRSAGNVNGIYDLLKMVEGQSSRNYLLNDDPGLGAISTYWLRGLHKLPQTGKTNGDILDSKIVGPGQKYLEELFTLARKKKRFILIDLLPYEYTGDPLISSELNCTFMSELNNSTLEMIAAPNLNIRCFTQEEMKYRLSEFIKKTARHVNGYVLDFSPWLVRDKEGRKVLESLVALVKQYDEIIATKQFKKTLGQKYIFMRMPIINRNVFSNSRQRQVDERAMREAGVRVIVETIDMISASNCNTSRCLHTFINEIQKPILLNESSPESGIEPLHRAFTVDDPVLSRRALPQQFENEISWSPESLAAFIIAALPGSPIVYYGSEIGMSHQSPITQMKWRNDKNYCDELDEEPYCFCAEYCNFWPGKFMHCPDEQHSDYRFPKYKSYSLHDDSGYPPAVYEQVKLESIGPLKAITNLTKAKMEYPSLLWGRANASMLETVNEGDNPALSVIRTSNKAFSDYILLLAYDAKAASLPEQIEQKCYVEVVFHKSPSSSTYNKNKKKRGRFDQIVVMPGEVRLLEITDCSSGYTAKALSPYIYLLISIVCCLCNTISPHSLFS